MRKLKLVGLFAMMLVVAMVLSACATVADLNKVLNEKYNTNEKLFTKAEAMSGMEDYAPVSELSNDEFVVFVSEEEEGSLKVFSFRSKSIVQTLSNSADTSYEVDLLDEVAAYVVTKTVAATEEDDEDTVMKYYHDATGAEILSVEKDKEIGGVKAITDKMVIINNVIFNVDEVTGAMTKKADVPAYVSYEDIDDYNDEYFYADADEGVIIYDIDFAPVAIYTAPSYAENVKWFALNNGNVLLQYTVVLDEDAKKFDYAEEGEKIDLVSLVVTPKGDVKNVNLDYVVLAVEDNADLYDDTKTAEENEYTDKFENIAVILRIENQLLDNEINNADIVLMNNSGKAQQSLKVVDGQVGIPTKVSDDLYLVTTVYGAALINAKGDVQFAMTQEVEFTGGYIVSDNGIYDLTFTLVYDFVANDADVENVIGNTIFVKAGDEDKYSIIAFCNGAQTTVYTYDVEAETNDEFDFVDEIGYVIIKADADTAYTYYAADGTSLLNVAEEAEFFAGNADMDVILASVEGEESTTYYVFSK
jgi:hypothetical protein